MARRKSLTAESYWAMSEDKKKDLMLKVCRGFAECCFQDAIRTGAVDPRGKSEPELNIELLRYTLDHLDAMKAAGDISWVIVHTKELLREARRFRRKQENGFAVLFYATWCEHWLNSLIQTGCDQKALSTGCVEQIIRDASFRAKATWVIQLLGFPPIPSDQLGLISQLQNLRNGFVHYKFKAQGEEAMKQHKSQLATAVEGAEDLVRKLMHYEDVYVFKLGRKQTSRLARKLGRKESTNSPKQVPDGNR